MSLSAMVLVLALLGGQDPGANQPYPTPEELTAEINAARTDPRGYAEHLRTFRSYFQDTGVLNRPGRSPIRPLEGVASVDEAIAALEHQPPLPPLTVDPVLSNGAAVHVADQGPTGGMGHVGSDGSDATQRAQRYGPARGVGENISYGEMTARDVVIQFLVDAGVPSRGHRANIFRDYETVGGACGPHARYQRMCVINFGL